MPNHQPTGAQVSAVQHALDQELPSRMRRTWWDGAATFFADCPDYTAGLHDSELADYVREMPRQGKCFIVRWHEGGARLRCKLL